MRRVLCVWEDASDLDEGTFIERKDAPEPKATIFHQVGFLMSISASELILLSVIGDELMGVRTRIPAGMVRMLTELVDGEPIALPKRRKRKLQ